MEQLSPSQQLIRLAFGFIPARAIYIAAKYRLIDAIGSGQKSVGDLAAETGLNAEALGRICRLLAAIGVLEETGDNSFRTTEVAQPLSSRDGSSLRDYIMVYHELVYKAFEHIPHTVETGTPSWAHVFGKPIFETIEADPDIASLFHAGLRSRASAEMPALLKAFDFSNVKHVTDVGGGNGNLLSAILSSHPHLNGTLFDVAPAIEAAKAGKGGPLPRCELTIGDFFQSVPKGADVYIMKFVLHDWSDDESVKILQNCRAAMSPTSKLWVIEGIMGDKNSLTNMNYIDLNMMVSAGGQERSRREYSEIFSRANLQLIEVIPTSLDPSILVGAPC